MCRLGVTLIGSERPASKRQLGQRDFRRSRGNRVIADANASPQPTALGRTIELAGRLLSHAGHRGRPILLETTAAACLRALLDEHGSLVARCRSLTSGLPRRFRAHPVGHPVARDRVVVWATCATLGSVLAGIAALDLKHGEPAVAWTFVFLTSLAIVAALLAALRRHRIRLSRAEAIRVAVWSIALFQLWEVVVVGAVLARLASLGVW